MNNNEDGMLSQDEIDALLNITENDDNNEQDNEANDAKDDEQKDQHQQKSYLTPLEKDALGEIGNISFGSSATTLSTLLNQKVEITTPTVSIVRKTGLKEEYPYEHVKLQVNFIDGFDGENIFLMKAKDAAIISDIMLGGEGLNPKQELTEIELSAVQEAMNQMMGASATSMSTVFNKRVDISPPSVHYEDIDKLEEVEGIVDDEDLFVKVSFELKVGDLIDSHIMQLIPIEFAKELVEQLLGPEDEVAATTVVEAESTSRQAEEVVEDQVEEQAKEKEEIPVQTKEKVEEKEEIPIMANEQTERITPTPNEDTSPQQIGANIHEQSTVQTASFSDFESVELSGQGQRNLDMLLDIPLSVTVELGRTTRKVAEILELTTGSIVELDKLAGEPVDVLVNNKLIAKGEVVVIDENFGVRITDVVSQKDRLMKLN